MKQLQSFLLAFMSLGLCQTALAACESEQAALNQAQWALNSCQIAPSPQCRIDSDCNAGNICSGGNCVEAPRPQIYCRCEFQNRQAPNGCSIGYYQSYKVRVLPNGSESQSPVSYFSLCDSSCASADGSACVRDKCERSLQEIAGCF